MVFHLAGANFRDEYLKTLLQLALCPAGGVVRHALRVLYNLISDPDISANLCKRNYVALLLGKVSKTFLCF